MKTKRGQMGQAGALILLAITLIVGAILLVASAQNTGTVTNTETLANYSLDTVVNGTTQYITTHKAISDVVIINETGGVVIGAGNYTITNHVPYNGQEAISILPDTAAAWKTAWKVSGTVEPLTYANDAGARSITGLIIILMALALAAVAVGAVAKGYTGN